MLNRLLIAVVLGVVAGLVCLLVGSLLATIPVPFVVTVGGFLVTWAWVIGLLVAIYSFATGRATLI